MNTYRITTRDMAGGLVAMILTGFRDGVVATRMNAAVVQPASLVSYLSEMRDGLTARGVIDEDALAAARRPQPVIAFGPLVGAPLPRARRNRALSQGST